MNKKLLIYIGLGFLLYKAISIKIEENNEKKIMNKLGYLKENDYIEVPDIVKNNEYQTNQELNLPDDFYQSPNQSDRDYVNIFNNKITPLNYMYRSNDDVDKKNVYSNQYILKKYINVEGIGSPNDENELFAIDEYEQDNYSYIPKDTVLMYNEEL